MSEKQFLIIIAVLGLVAAIASSLAAGLSVFVGYAQLQSDRKTASSELAVLHQQLSTSYERESNESKVRYEDRKAAIEVARKANSPLLAILEPCITVPIAVVDEWQMHPKVKNRRIGLLPQKKSDCVSCKQSALPIAIATNFGMGTAFDCRYEWHVKTIDFSKRSDVRVEDGDPIPLMPHDFWPMHLADVDTSSVMTLPRALANDLNFDVVSMSGFLVLTCKASSGTKHEFSHAFQATPYYAPLKPDFAKDTDDPFCTANIQFQFTNHAWCDGPYPRRLTSPPLQHLSEVVFGGPYSIQGYRGREPQEADSKGARELESLSPNFQ